MDLKTCVAGRTQNIASLQESHPENHLILKILIQTKSHLQGLYYTCVPEAIHSPFFQKSCGN